MLAVGEDDLICDFAETYHILDWKELPLKKAALLAYGLRDSSRIKMKIAGITGTPDQLLLALIHDRLAILQWFQTEDGHNGRNRPESLYSRLAGEAPREKGFKVYASGSDFDAAFYGGE